jgi:hypothetical protein
MLPCHRCNASRNPSVATCFLLYSADILILLYAAAGTGLAGSILEGGRSMKRLVTGACDNTVRVWQTDGQASGGNVGGSVQWREEALQGGGRHADWVSQTTASQPASLSYMHAVCLYVFVFLSNMHMHQ